jgi:glutaredoxin-like protein NrdH
LAAGIGITTVDSETILLYSKPLCSFCEQSKQWLTRNGFAYKVIDVTTDAEALAFIKSRGHQKVPQLYIGENLLVEGGFTGLIKLGAVGLRERLEK